MRISLFFLLHLGFSAWATEPSVTAELATRNAFLGDAVALDIRITHDPSYTVVKDSLGGSLGDATVLEQVWTPAGTGEKPLDYTQLTLKLAWYRLGEAKVPPLEIRLESSGQLPQLVETPELAIDIVNMLTEEDQAAAPPKGQVALNVPSLWPMIAGGLLLFAIIVAGIVWYLKRPKPEVVVPPPPPEPPYTEAIEALRASSNLLKEGKVKEFYVTVNLIVRHYYARLFFINAEEMTSFELEEWMEDNAQKLPGELFYLNRAFQEPCDRVKFAKHDPVEAENKETTNRAYQIVEMLKPMALAMTEEANDVAAG